MPGLFITAMGTDVGKTYVAAGLIRAGRRAGLAMAALKPVLTGFSRASAAGSDAALLLEAMGEALTDAALDRVAPWRFEAPLSPDMAAALEGRAIAVDDVVALCRQLAIGEPLAVIEGIGGVMVPLDERRTILDVMVALALPVVLVSGTGLGAISACLTALAAMRGRDLVPAVIVLNETAGATVPLHDTHRTLERFCDGVPFAIVPREASDTVFDIMLAGLRGVVSGPS